MAVEAINQEFVDEVWIVPCGDRDDIFINESKEHRLQMLKLIVNDYFKEEFPIKVDFYIRMHICYN